MIRTYRETAHTWYLIARGLDIIKDTRNTLKTNQENNQDINGLNSIIILSSASTVEGAISSLLINHISKGSRYKTANRNSDLELKNILEDLIKQIDKASWNELVLKTLMITGIDLKKDINFKEWESISNLFDFRNILAHGGSILKGADMISSATQVNEIKEEVRKDTHSRAGLFKFLIKKRLIDQKEKYHLIKWEFLNSEVADYFMLTAKQFMEATYKCYTSKFPNNPFINEDLKLIEQIRDR